MGIVKKRLNSCQKGKRGEREVVELLDRMTGEKFMRVPSSGALWTVLGAKPLCGDVMPVNGSSPWKCYVEVKFFRNIDLFSPIWKAPARTDKSHLGAIWKKAKTEAARVDRKPLVFFRSNRSPWFAMMDESMLPQVEALDPANRPSVVLRIRVDAISTDVVSVIEATSFRFKPKEE